MHAIIEITAPRQSAPIELTVGVTPTPFGSAVLCWDALGVRQLGLHLNPTQALEALSSQSLLQDDRVAANVLSDILNGRESSMPIVLCGTPFQREVWRALIQTERGQTMSYGELAQTLGRPTATRAVASAVAANRIGLLVPCHRVVRQDGFIGQFRWGSEIKRQLLDWEAHRSDG
jgi:AraC family transcriptional regulator of adaptative response/methylated-DNA-[protein]-cysteine methyltransferase